MKPLVLLNHSNAHKLAVKYPGRIGMLLGPSRSRPVNGLPVALDNDRFSCWMKGKGWDEEAFIAMLDKVQAETDPLWVVVPDCVGDADLTFRDWDFWEPRLRKRGLKCALAVQDGMTAGSVRRRTCNGRTPPDMIFIGGTTLWKRKTIWQWCHEFPRVHVGRVNTEKWLWNAHRCGAESTDGTGWFRGNRKQLGGLLRYLRRSERFDSTTQMELEFSRFGAT